MVASRQEQAEEPPKFPAGKVEISDQEREAFVWMQGRLVELLLRHYVVQFGETFGERQADLEQFEDERLAHYRELAVVVYLQEALFNHILPRIKRRLSFETPRDTKIEKLPARGRIDWPRTMNAGWRDWPGEVPLEVHTRQRRRHFATPENLLTVVTILEYRRIVQRLLNDEIEQDRLQALRHPITEIIEQCQRELAFLQFAGLLAESDAIINGHSVMTTEELEQKVADNLLPGHNSAYSELLDWRQRLWNLSLLDQNEQANNPRWMLGADPRRDNYLYQLWLLYEIVEMLHQQQKLLDWNPVEMKLSYTWGEGETACQYELQYDQTIKLPFRRGNGSVEQRTLEYWRNAPGVRPDFYIRRSDQPVLENGKGRLIWHAPGYVLDAKYYKPRGSLKAPASPVKRMIADLQLTGEHYGALLFAFQQGGPKIRAVSTDDEEETTAVKNLLIEAELTLKPTALYRVIPEEISAQYVQPDIQVNVWRLRPDLTGQHSIPEVLEALFEQVHQALQRRIAVRCQGIFLDSLSATAHGELATLAAHSQRNGQAWKGDLDDLILCPKPHIAPWRVDLVSQKTDCCQNHQLCHIIGQPGVRPPQRLTALEEIESALKTSQVGEAVRETEAEAITQTATRQVLVITRRYADLIKPNMDDYRQWFNKNLYIGDLFENTPLLNNEQRDTLALGRFLWEQIEKIKAQNFAGPALLFTGILEELTRVTIYKINGPLYGDDGKKLMDTLGTLGNCKGFGGTNWTILEQAIVQNSHWNSQIVAGQAFAFDKWIDSVKSISFVRNDAAHRANVSSKAFQSLVNRLFGSPASGMGVLNGLLLAWRD
jgi:hypothetical protein